MQLSIVIPVLDEATTIVATLEALQPLRRAGHEVIVVDGGSRDTTCSLAESRADRIIVTPRGRALQMNAGAAIAAGDAVVFLHADTRLPDAADRAVEDALRAGHRWGRFDVRIHGRSMLLPIVAGAMNLRSRLSGIATGDQAMFVERRLFDDVGGYAALPLMEDIELSARLKRTAGAPACVASAVLTSGRRWDANGALRTMVAMWRARLDYWRGVPAAALARRYYPPAPPALLVFAKDPQPGAVKTRLATTMGSAAAAMLYRDLVERTLRMATQAREQGIVGDVILYGTPSKRTPAFANWERVHRVALAEQAQGDLGARMRAALDTALQRNAPALLIGTDAPDIDVAYIAQAAHALDSHDAVLGPAEDGGYVLIGLRRPLDLFDGIAWGRADVMAMTRAQLRQLDATWSELPTSWDVDRPADVERWERLRETRQTSTLTRSDHDQL